MQREQTSKAAAWKPGTLEMAVVAPFSEIFGDDRISLHSISTRCRTHSFCRQRINRTVTFISLASLINSWCHCLLFFVQLRELPCRGFGFGLLSKHLRGGTRQLHVLLRSTACIAEFSSAASASGTGSSARMWPVMQPCQVADFGRAAKQHLKPSTTTGRAGGTAGGGRGRGGRGRFGACTRTRHLASKTAGARNFLKLQAHAQLMQA